MKAPDMEPYEIQLASYQSDIVDSPLNITRVFSYGMNNPTFLAQLMKMPVENITNTAIPAYLPEYQVAMAALTPEQKDYFFYATVVPMQNQSAIGFIYEATPDMLKIVDGWEVVGTDYTREQKTFVNMWTNETIEAYVYIKTHDHEISIHAVHERMPYLFQCYLTQRFYYELLGQVDTSDVYDYDIFDSYTHKYLTTLEVPMSIDYTQEEEFLGLRVHNDQH